jgi:hypothetical protein
VVRVKMCDECGLQTVNGQTLYPLLGGGGRSANDTWSEVDKIGRAVDDDCRTRTEPVRQRPRCPGPEHDDVGSTRR